MKAILILPAGTCLSAILLLGTLHWKAAVFLLVVFLPIFISATAVLLGDRDF